MKATNNRITHLYRIFFFLACWLSFPYPSANAQSSFFRNYSVDDGLAFVYVTAICQDIKGNLWAGGYGGLSKFNGNSFTNYGAKQGLVHHDVTSIANGRNGDLWIGTSKGVSKYQNGAFTNYTQKDGLIDDHVYDIIMDEEGLIWIATEEGLSIFDGTTFSNLSKEDGLVSNRVLTLYQDSKARIWCGTNNGVSIWYMRSFTNYTEDDGLCSNIVNVISEDGDGNIYLGTTKGLSVFDREIDTCISINDQLLGNEIISIETDRHGDIWVGTLTGLLHYNGGQFTKYSLGSRSNDNFIESLFFDRERNLWVGTYSGLYKYAGNSFVSYNEADGLENNFIFQIFKDSRGLLWIGTSGGGLYLYDGEEFYSYTKENGLSGDFVLSGGQDRNGNIWIGTDEGLSKCIFKDKLKKGIKRGERPDISFVNFTTDDGLISDSINCIYEDSKGTLWLAGTGGVSTYLPVEMQSKGYTFSKHRLSYLDNNFWVWSIMEDKEGDIWFGTFQGGLYRYDGKNFVEDSEKMGFKSDACLAITKDKEGNLFFGTFDGVYMYDGKQLLNFSEEDGMSSDLVYSMIFGKDEKNLWIGTNQGLNKLKIDEFKRTGKKVIEIYSKDEGFTGVECNSNGVYREDNGVIWYGTVNGLLKFDPNEYHENLSEAETNITAIRIFYNDTILKENSIIPYRLNHISFSYIGLCLTNPNKVRYQYMLEGFDDWSPITNINFATYSYLPPGNYTFKVISCNNEGIWNHEPASFSFTIDTPFWKTWWFRTGSLLLIASLTWFLIYVRMSNLKRKSDLNRRMDQIKLQALRSQMNPHFLFNSLNAVQHYINDNEKKLANIYLAKFAELIRLVLNNSQESKVSINEDLQALELYIQLQQLRFENRFEYTIEVGSSLDRDNVSIPPLLIQPYVENAITHGLLNKKGDGKVRIAMKLENNFIICTVEDDGIGRLQANEIRIYHKDLHHKPVGMKLTKERLETLNIIENSSLSVDIDDLTDEDGNPCGTKVTIYIPSN